MNNLEYASANFLHHAVGVVAIGTDGVSLAESDNLLEDVAPTECINVWVPKLFDECLPLLQREQDATALLADALHDDQRVFEVPGVEHWQLERNVTEVSCTIDKFLAVAATRGRQNRQECERGEISITSTTGGSAYLHVWQNPRLSDMPSLESMQPWTAGAREGI